MLLSDTSIKRPVFASVIGLLLIAIGIVSFTRLALREYPDVDPPIVTIRTSYAGASANVVENRITEDLPTPPSSSNSRASNSSPARSHAAFRRSSVSQNNCLSASICAGVRCRL